MKAILAITFATVLTVAPCSFAQNTTQHDGHHPDAPAVKPAPDEAAPPATSSRTEMGKGSMTGMPMTMHKPMDEMHQKMASMKMTGDPDIDFAMMMVGHHQGAIEMAQAEIDGGKNPAMIKIAKKIIVTQKKEIAQFEDWLKKHPHSMK